MTLREAIGQLFLLGFEGNRSSEPLKAFLSECNPGGLILFSRNVGSPEEVAELTTALQAATLTPLFIAIDQEGGRVARLRPPFTEWPSPSVVGAVGSVKLTYAWGEAMAKELLAVGINMNMAPVLDVQTNPENPVIGDRSFGADPQMVGQLGTAFFWGHRDAGVLAVGKHFPGHGDTAVDSHLSLPVVPHELARLLEVELVPFIEVIGEGIGALMTAHLLLPALDPERPATLSAPILTDLLRRRMGFSGLVMSDDLLMRGIADTASPGEAAVRFLEAGGDLILICQDEAAQREALVGVTEAVERGRLSEARIEESRDRIARAKAHYARQASFVSYDMLRQVVGCDAHRRLAELLLSRAA